MAETTYDFVVPGQPDKNLDPMTKFGHIDEEKFKQWVQQFKGTDYYDQFMNAYSTYAGQAWNPNLWQQLGANLFGDFSAESNFYNQKLAAFIDSISNIQNAMHKESYTDPLNEAARRRAAGLNDDLNGGAEIGSGTPGSVDDMQPGVGAMNDGSNAVVDLATTGIQIATTVMQMKQGLTALAGQALDNEMKSLLLSKTFQEHAWNMIQDSTTEYFNLHGKEFENIESLDDPSFVNLIPSISQSFAGRVNDYPYSDNEKKKLRRFIDKLAFVTREDGAKIPTARYQTLLNNQFTKLSDSRANYVEAYGRLGGDIEDAEGLRVLSMDVIRPINEAIPEITRMQNEVARLQAQFDTNYLTGANKIGLPGMRATTEYASLKLAKEIKSAQDKVAETFRRINYRITNSKDLSADWKIALQSGVAVGEALLLSKLSTPPSINFGGSSSHEVHGYDSRRGYYDQETIDSRSPSFSW